MEQLTGVQVPLPEARAALKASSTALGLSGPGTGSESFEGRTYFGETFDPAGAGERAGRRAGKGRLGRGGWVEAYLAGSLGWGGDGEGRSGPLRCA